MLLSITYSGENATDLGFLLHKNPTRPQVFRLNFGKAYVFYPEANEQRCTAALLLDIDPIDLARGKAGSKDGGLFDYVNDRPYVCSSFMSTAISSVYGSAMAGRSEERQELADSALRLSATVTMLPCRGDNAMLERVFAPLGYSVEFTGNLLDEKYPEWGDSPCVDLSISGTVRLRDLLSHLYVLIPVFDRRKHYWTGEDEVKKLLRHGEGWLKDHPERGFITSRYFDRSRRLAQVALDRMDGENGEDGSTGEVFDRVRVPKLNKRRLEAVVAVLREKGVHSVIDMGCGSGKLLRMLLRDGAFGKIAGTDVSLSALEYAARRLRIDEMSDAQKNRVVLFQSSLTYRDKRFGGYDAAACVEVVEHIDLNRLPAFAQAVFEAARPGVVVLTTPNAEYNEKFVNMYQNQAQGGGARSPLGLTGPPETPYQTQGGGLRHGDHRFEWTREQFRTWGDAVAEKYGYSAVYSDIGDSDEKLGAQTQMGVFTLCE
jgi:3' terminal RNA ribose 2'-O-methyltransferase Hen1